MFFSHRTFFYINFMGIVDQPVKDAIGDSRIANDVMPVFYGQLTGNDGWSMPVSFIYNFKEISSVGISQGCNTKVINDQDITNTTNATNLLSNIFMKKDYLTISDRNLA